MAVPETALVSMPQSASFAQAVALPHAGCLALQGLRDVGGIVPGSRVLINGAGGGVGTLGLQLARHFGAASVTAVDRADKLERLRALGFDEVIDYEKTDFADLGGSYDLVLDARLSRGPLKCLRALAPKGVYAIVGGATFRLLQAFVMGGILRLLTGKRIRLVALKNNQDLDLIGALQASGVVRPVIDSTHTLAELPQALERFGQANHFGKIIVTMP